MKKILITGCGSGLGRESAIALADRGHYVYATAHTEEQGKNINSDKFTTVHIDKFIEK
ncbi:SDR family NAD(P)-dependent oxidoreductase [Clostridium sp.]|uniref:SDR family NAD(P)-dependent oxidoreductase n=1 Tax=Clostridium sp. TaxID=1506 RepID=UPI0037BFD7E3